MRTAAFVGVSLDGFIARPDGRLDWLTGDGPPDPDAGDHGYGAFIATIDTVLLGRKTFETVLGFTTWPYEGLRVVVLSTTLPPAVADKAEVHRGPLPALLSQLAAEGCQGLYVDGGVTIQGFLRAGLLDELTISRLPVLIGQGVPLFGDLDCDVRLDHVQTQVMAGGMVQSLYCIQRPGSGNHPGAAA